MFLKQKTQEQEFQDQIDKSKYLFPKCFNGVFIMLLTTIDDNENINHDFKIVQIVSWDNCKKKKS